MASDLYAAFDWLWKLSLQDLGSVGDYVGGVCGTAVGAITLLVVWKTWESSRHAEAQDKTYRVFAEMLRTHEEIIGSLRLGGLRGRDALQAVLSEFYCVYKLTREVEPSYLEWETESRVNIAFTIVFYGRQLQSVQLLEHNGTQKILSVISLVEKERLENERSDAPDEKRFFPGHQSRLSHYFRNLYSACLFIGRSRLPADEKESLASVLRSKLSNYEQAIVALYLISQFGHGWRNAELARQYAPIKDIPEYFFSFDPAFLLKDSFPWISFEFECD